jgi:1-acyl-sn-glycerol-3-phosphate acyltransferase
MSQSVKNILGRVFAVWGILCFVVTMLVVLIPIGLAGLWKEPKRSVISHHTFAIWMDVFFALVGIRRIIKGRDHFKPGENYVIVCNHNSYMDVPLSSGSIPAPNKTIAKIEMAKIPMFGLIYKRGSVLVNRKSDQSRKESYIKMKDVLKMGLHMCIYPEGTRNKTDEPLQPFHDGAFRLAVDTGTPVMPTLLFYTRIVLPQNKGFYFWPHPVEMHFLPPVPPGEKTVPELKQEVYGLMKKFYLRHNQKL